MAQRFHDAWDLREFRGLQRDHGLIDSMIRGQKYQLFQLVDALLFHGNMLAGESDESADLAWRKRQALQPSRSITRELIGAYH